MLSIHTPLSFLSVLSFSFPQAVICCDISIALESENLIRFTDLVFNSFDAVDN